MSDVDSRSAERGDGEVVSIVESDECLRPAEAFAGIGNETRFAILEALWEAEDRPVSCPSASSPGSSSNAVGSAPFLVAGALQSASA